MDLPRRTKYFLLGFMVGVILYLKYPQAPHEYGVDGFGNHGMTNVLISLDYAPWLIHPASFYALYPFSYAPGISILFGSLADLSGLSIEHIILALLILFTLLGMAGMFMFTGEVKDQFEIKFMAGFLFVLTPAISFNTTWNASTRGPFICLLTLLLWALARTFNARHKSRFFLLGIIFIGILPTIHHFALLLPILLIAMVASIITYRVLEYTERVSVYYRENVMIASGIIFVFMVFLFYLQATSVDLYSPDLSYFKVWFVSGNQDSPVTTSINILVFYGISMGILMLFGGIGLAHVLGKVDKTKVEWSILFFIVFFSMFLIDKTYLVLFVIPLFIPFFALGLIALMGKLEYRKSVYVVCIGVLLLLASYYNIHTTQKFIDAKAVDEMDYKFHMQEDTYNSALYLRHTVYEINGPLGIHNDERDKKRISALSAIPMMPLNEQIILYAYPNITERVSFERYSISDMYFDHRDHMFYVNWTNSSIQGFDKYSQIVGRPWGDPMAVQELREFRVSWAIVNVYFPDEVGKSSQPFLNRPSKFFASLPDERYKIYENDYESVYFLFDT